eukprot:gene34404-41639_t
MSDLPSSITVGDLSINYDLLPNKYFMMRLVGTAANENAEVLTEAFNTVVECAERYAVNGLVLHLVDLSFCYSACVKVIMSSLMSWRDRPPTEIIIGKATWQVTSVRAMGSMMHNTMVVEQGGSLFMKDATYANGMEGLQAAMATAGVRTPVYAPHRSPSTCTHPSTDTREEQFFAPTGSGSIKTSVFCTACGTVLRETSEYFD